MSLTKEAIDALLAKGRSESVIPVMGNKSDNHPAVILHDPKLTPLLLDKFRPYKRHYSAKYNTSAIEPFMVYVLANVVENAKTEVFVDAEHMSAVSVLDARIPVLETTGEDSDAPVTASMIEKPGLCVHRAELSLRQHPDYMALHDNLGKWMSQRDAIEFVQSIPHTLDGADVLVRAFQKLKIKSAHAANSGVTALAEERSTMEQVEIKAEVEVPEIVEFKMVCYEELTDKSIPVRIAIRPTDDDSFKIRFSFVNLGTLRHELSAELTRIIINESGDAVSVFEGTIGY